MCGFTDDAQPALIPLQPVPPIVGYHVVKLTDAAVLRAVLQQSCITVDSGDEAVYLLVFLIGGHSVVLLYAEQSTLEGAIIQHQTPRVDMCAQEFESVLVGLVVELTVVHHHSFVGQPLP